MNVLSLCDGISCGQIALKKENFKVDKYFASEIDKNAIAITQKNFPNTIQIGDMKNIDEEFLKSLPKIDLIIAGTPCQNLSITVINDIKHNQGLDGEKSSLFYKFYEILEWLKKYNNPQIVFLLENVQSMKDKDRDIISECLNTKAIMIDSATITAQDRKRYYWTNLNVIEEPISEKINLVLKDIMEENVNEKYYYKESFTINDINKKVCATLHINGHDILKRVYNPNYKCGTLTAVCGGNQHKKVLDNGRVRKLTPTECERLQTLPENYTEGFSDSARYKAIGNGWTIDVIANILSWWEIC